MDQHKALSTEPLLAIDVQPSPLFRTRAAHRLLRMRGLEPDEAANVMAYIHRLRIGAQPWTLGQINALLFLRSLSDNGTFGAADGIERDRDVKARPR
jgi:hypothetical protein